MAGITAGISDCRAQALTIILENLTAEMSDCRNHCSYCSLPHDHYYLGNIYLCKVDLSNFIS
jgi:hypothetical protein